MSHERQNVYLRPSRHLSWFRKGEEVYLYHDLFGYVLAMDERVRELVLAFRDAEKPGAIVKAFDGVLPAAQAEGFIHTLRQQRVLVGRRADEEEDAFCEGYPVRGPWLVSWSDGPDQTVLAYRDRGLGRMVLERLEGVPSRAFHRCDGEHTIEEIAEQIGTELGADVDAEVRGLVFRLTHSDRQVLKLVDRPLFSYLAFPPAHLRSVIPFPRIPQEGEDTALEEAAEEEQAARGTHQDVIDLAAYHRSVIEDARDQFDVGETTLSHMFKDPHPALFDRSYGEAFAEALIGRELLPEAGRAGRIVEVGGGVGFFAQRLRSALEQRVPRAAGQLRYTILDLAPALQASQRAVNAASERPITFLQADASRPLPLTDQSVDLLLSNEVIADLLTVRMHSADVGAPSDPSAPEEVRAAYRLMQRHALPAENAPVTFWLNYGALAFLEEITRVLTPGGAAVLTEFGELDAYPVESVQLDHPEFSIHFGHLVHVAGSLGLSAEVIEVPELLGFDDKVMVLTGTRTWFEGLRLLLSRGGVTLEKRPYTEPELRALVGAEIGFEHLRELRFEPVLNRALGLRPREFKALILRKDP